MDRDGAQLVEEGDRGKQSPSRSFRSEFSLMDRRTRRCCAGTGSVPFNILLLLCFLTCIALFAVTLIKYSELTEEMKRGQPSSMNLTQTLESIGKSTAQLTKFMAFMCNLCPVGWLRYNNTCYLFSDTSLVHRMAREACESQDAHLLIIENQQEVDFLAQNTKSKGYWMDLTDAGSEGKWHWGNGKPLTYSNWNTGEPNNDRNNEDCAEFLSSGSWNDSPCSISFRYICKTKGQC